MTEKYLPIKESLGYQNLRIAMHKIFNFDIDKIQIREFDFEDFAFNFEYKSLNIKFNILETKKNAQKNAGEGGRLSISLDNPDYPKKSYIPFQTFSFLVTDDVADDVKYAFGNSVEKLDRALILLKEYLDNK